MLEDEQALQSIPYIFSNVIKIVAKNPTLQ